MNEIIEIIKLIKRIEMLDELPHTEFHEYVDASDMWEIILQLKDYIKGK